MDAAVLAIWLLRLLFLALLYAFLWGVARVLLRDLRAAAREPGDRYASAGDLKADVERWLDDSPVSAWPSCSCAIAFLGGGC